MAITSKGSTRTMMQIIKQTLEDGGDILYVDGMGDYEGQVCYNCEGYFEDNNNEGCWQECRNPNSKYYCENINNISDKKCDNWLPVKQPITKE